MKWLEAVGVLDHAAMLDAVSEMMWSYRGYEQHGGDEKKARNALKRKRACLGYPSAELGEAFDVAMAVWDEMEVFVASQDRRYVYLSGQEFEEFRRQLGSQLKGAFPDQEHAIGRAMNWIQMNRDR